MTAAMSVRRIIMSWSLEIEVRKILEYCSRLRLAVKHNNVEHVVVEVVKPPVGRIFDKIHYLQAVLSTLVLSAISPITQNDSF